MPRRKQKYYRGVYADLFDWNSFIIKLFADICNRKENELQKSCSKEVF